MATQKRKLLKHEQLYKSAIGVISLIFIVEPDYCYDPRLVCRICVSPWRLKFLKGFQLADSAHWNWYKKHVMLYATGNLKINRLACSAIMATQKRKLLKHEQLYKSAIGVISLIFIVEPD